MSIETRLDKWRKKTNLRIDEQDDSITKGKVQACLYECMLQKNTNHSFDAVKFEIGFTAEYPLSLHFRLSCLIIHPMATVAALTSQSLHANARESL
jgi:hypothetical protein